MNSPKINAELKIRREEVLGELKRLDPDLWLLSAVLHDTVDAITVQNYAGNYIEWNKGAEMMYGWTALEAKQMNISQLMPADTLEETLELLERVKITNESESLETKRLTKSGAVLDVWATVTTVVDDHGIPFAISTVERDITEKKKVENDLLALTEKLLQSNQDLRDFTFMVAHDLREPLLLINTFCTRLLTKKDLQTERQEEYLKKMEKSSQRALQLIESLLTYSRITLSTDDYRTVDLSQIIQNVLSDLEERIKQAEAKLEIGELPVLRADPIQMHQLFLNLIGNALKFSQKGQPPEVKVLCQIQQQAKSKQSVCEITVEDKGIGFHEENGDKIFLLGHRLHDKSHYEGSGIGLSICKRIIERHKGTIAAKSIPGQGTKFIITLPLS